MSADPSDIRARIFARLLQPEWTAADLAILDAAIALGSPSQLHAGGPPLTAEYDTDPGGVRAMRPVTDARATLAADALHVYRGAAVVARVEFPVAGK